MPAHADTLTIAMVGDIMMGTTFPSQMLPANNGNDLFVDAKPLLLKADLTVGNLEGTLCDGGKSTKGTGKNSYAFRTPTSYAHHLRDCGWYQTVCQKLSLHLNDLLFARILLKQDRCNILYGPVLLPRQTVTCRLRQSKP